MSVLLYIHIESYIYNMIQLYSWSDIYTHAHTPTLPIWCYLMLFDARVPEIGQHPSKIAELWLQAHLLGLPLCICQTIRPMPMSNAIACSAKGTDQKSHPWHRDCHENMTWSVQNHLQSFSLPCFLASKVCLYGQLRELCDSCKAH